MFNYQELIKGKCPYVIAEIGANHNGDMELAKKMIDTAVECGADSVKFQSWTNKSLICKQEYDANQRYDDDPKKHFGSLKEMVDRYYLRRDQHFQLKEYCDSLQVDFCSTPFSPKEVDLLCELDVPFIKVASMDINHWPLLEYIASKGKPVILSTGMADLSEIDDAVRLLERAGVTDIALLHCISIYPPKDEDIHLNNMNMLSEGFGYPVGLSDHSIGSTIPLAAVALGATIIEKHFTTDKQMEGWDHMISADPKELSDICQGAKSIVAALGHSKRRVSDAELEKRHKFRRSVVLKKSMRAGEIIGPDDLDLKRPGTAIPPTMVSAVIGRTLNADLEEDAILQWQHLR